MTFAETESPARSLGGTVVSVSRNEAYTFTKPARDEIVLVAGFGIEGDVHAGVRVRHRGRVRADPTQPNLRQVHLIQGELFEEVAVRGFQVGAGQLGENVTTGGIDLLGLPVGTILRFGPLSASAAPAEVPAAPAEGARLAAPGRETTAGPLEGVFAAAAAAELDAATTASVAALRAAVARDREDDPRPAIVLAGLRNPCAQINTFRPGLLKEVLGRDEDGRLVLRAGVMAVVLRGGAVRAGDVVTAELPPGPFRPLERV